MQGSRFTGSCCWRFGALAIGCGQDGSTDELPIAPVGPEIHGLHIVGNHLEDNAGNPVTLRGVNRSGTEYMCVKGGGVFDGAWGLATIAAIASWKANAVRIPLNETCWLGPQTNRTAPATRIRSVSSSACCTSFTSSRSSSCIGPRPVRPPRSMQQPMPDADHAVDFWTDVATTFANDDGVVFELYNEPFPDSNHDSTTAWQCWRDGCMSTLWALNPMAGG